MNTELSKINEGSLQLVVQEQSIGTLVTNAKQVKELVKAALPKYTAENYSETNIDQAKKDKALLNKFAKEINSKRLEVQREWMVPFDEFKAEVDEIVSLTKDASSKIDEVVKAVDEREREEKLKEIKQYFSGLDFTLVDYDAIHDPKWLNKTTSMKSIRESIDEQVNTIQSNLKSIEAIGGDDEEVLKSHYLTTLSLDNTLQYAKTLKDNRERLEAERKRREAEEQEAQKSQDAVEVVEEVVPQTDTRADTRETEPKHEEATAMYVRTFRVCGTRDQIIALGDFMNTNGIRFEKL